MKKETEIEIILTKEGSHTLYCPDLDEVYHSRFGAIRESRHVFIEHGFKTVKQSQLHIFEVGFGTGLNSLLTCMESKTSHIHTFYDTIELYPLDPAVTEKLNYPEILNDTENIFRRIHQVPWNETVQISPWFTLKKIRNDLSDFIPEKKYNLIYFDAFAPDIQPELWKPEILNKMAGCLFKGGILVTYTAKSSVRKTMEKSGLQVEKLPGPPGKREMTRAIKVN